MKGDLLLNMLGFNEEFYWKKFISLV